MEHFAFVVVVAFQVVLSNAAHVDNLEFAEEGVHHLEKRGLIAPDPYPQEYPPWIDQPGTPWDNEPAIAQPPLDIVYDYVGIDPVQPLDPPVVDPEPFIPSRPARKPCSCKGKFCSRPCRLG